MQQPTRMIVQSAKPELTIQDYQNLLSLLNGTQPLWGVDSLNRCVKAGLVTPTGRFLSFEGQRKAQRIQEVTDTLKRGVPLESRTADRSSEIAADSWYRTYWDVIGVSSQKHIFWNDHAIFGGKCPVESVRVSSDEEPYSTMYSIVRGGLMCKSWMKLAPFAVQIDALGGMECICFQPVVRAKNAKPVLLRMQSRYYDYAMQTYSQVTFWYREKSQDGTIFPIAVRTSPTEIKDNYSAFIMPVQGNWEPLN